MAGRRISADLVVRRVGELVTMNEDQGDGPLGLIRDGAVAMRDGRIAWVGSDDAVASMIDVGTQGEEMDAAGGVIIPGLVDCHTHTIFAGDRAAEYEMRARGLSYAEIAQQGGGIANTMGATREASFDDLMDLTLRRLTRALSMGVTTLEIKSGYGLDLDTELKILQVAHMADFSHPVDVVPTFLGAHTLPPEYKNDRRAYVDLVVEEMIPQVAADGLARFCDVFCEAGAFTAAETRRILTAAQRAGLGARVHAEQLSHSGGALVAAELGAASADHLEYASDADLTAMAAAGTVAVLLPGAAFFLGQTLPDARRFLDRGVKVALATDFNPGSSPTQNLPLMGTMAVSQMGMTPGEALRAMTLTAAQSLNLGDEIGSIEVGKAADLALFAATDYRSIFYRFGELTCAAVIKGGQPVHP